MNVVQNGAFNGTLFIHGGGHKDLKEFIELIGGADRSVVVIPTAAEGDYFDNDSQDLKKLYELGLRNLTILHTRDRDIANQPYFVEPLRKANAVWIVGGRQWRLADAYLDTLVVKELFRLLDRGGVIGGTSAGASIQGSFLVRGDTKTNEIMIGDHLQGFGFLNDTAIDQHLLPKNRQFDLIEVIEKYPDLLGIGIDEDTAIVVRNEWFEVVGHGVVAIYSCTSTLENKGKFYFLTPGDRFHLKTREAYRSDARPVERVSSRKWSEI